MRLPKIGRSLLILGLLFCLSLLLSGCQPFGGAQNMFSPEGTVSEKQRDLFLLVLWPAAVIFLLVEGLCVYIVFRYRRKKGDDTIPRQTHGNTLIEVGWTVAPVILLAIMAVPTLAGIIDLGRDPKADALTVDVTGIRWQWQFTYPDVKDASGNEVSEFATMHIPAGREIGIKLTSPDVIHSFWIPKLAGKTDVIPGRENHMWLKADHPGEYSAQCAEFCGGNAGGDGHQNMRFRVIVQSPEDFAAWSQEQAKSGGSIDQQQPLASRE